MDRKASVYSQISETQRLDLWSGINQGRGAYHTLNEYIESWKSKGKNGRIIPLVEEVLRDHNVAFLKRTPFSEYSKPRTLRQAASQIEEGRANFDEIVELNSPLVKYVARRHSVATEVGVGLTMADLEGYGQIGLVQAVDRFDHTGDVKFSYFATFRIEGAIRDAIRSLSPLSRDEATMVRSINKAIQEYWQQHGKAPSTAELSALTNLDQNTVRVISHLASVTTTPLDYSDEEADGRITLPTLQLKSNYGLEDRPNELPDILALREALTSGILNDRESTVIKEYFFNSLTLAEIANELGFSTSRASQILAAAVKKLRGRLAGQPIEDKRKKWVYVHEMDMSNTDIKIAPTPEPIAALPTYTEVNENAKSVEKKIEMPLLVRGFQRIREDLVSDLLQLAQTNLQLRTQEVPYLDQIIESEAKIKATSREIHAIAYFIDQLSDLTEAGIPMPQISPLVIQADSPVPAIQEVPLIHEIQIQDVSSEQNPAVIMSDSFQPVGINPSHADLNILLKAKQPATDDPEIMSLTERAQLGDSSAFEGIYARYIGPIYRRLLRMFNNPETALDAAQEVFVKAQEKIHSTKPGTTVGPWLYRMANNFAIDQIRGSSKKQTDYLENRPEVEDRAATLGIDSIDNTELSIDLAAVLEKLTSDQKAVLECRYLRGMDTRQTAQELGKTLDAVKKLQSRALAASRKMLIAQSSL